MAPRQPLGFTQSQFKTTTFLLFHHKKSIKNHYHNIAISSIGTTKGALMWLHAHTYSIYMVASYMNHLRLKISNKATCHKVFL